MNFVSGENILLFALPDFNSNRTFGRISTISFQFVTFTGRGPSRLDFQSAQRATLGINDSHLFVDVLRARFWRRTRREAALILFLCRCHVMSMSAVGYTHLFSVIKKNVTKPRRFFGSGDRNQLVLSDRRVFRASKKIVRLSIKNDAVEKLLKLTSNSVF